MEVAKNKLEYEIKIGNNTFVFKLYSLLAEKGISHNQFMKDTLTDYSTMKSYARGLIQRPDLSVLSRWCDYLDCEPNDIIDYKK